MDILPFGGQMKSELEHSYAGKLRDSLFWWLGKRRPFIINEEYKIELLYIDREHNSAKIRITNLKNQNSYDVNQEVLDGQDLA
jgi:hypothetical protein